MFKGNAKDYNCNGFGKAASSYHVCLLIITFPSPFPYSPILKFKGRTEREAWFVCPKRVQHNQDYQIKAEGNSLHPLLWCSQGRMDHELIGLKDFHTSLWSPLLDHRYRVTDYVRQCYRHQHTVRKDVESEE